MVDQRLAVVCAADSREVLESVPIRVLPAGCDAAAGDGDCRPRLSVTATAVTGGRGLTASRTQVHLEAAVVHPRILGRRVVVARAGDALRVRQRNTDDVPVETAHQGHAVAQG